MDSGWDPLILGIVLWVIAIVTHQLILTLLGLTRDLTSARPDPERNGDAQLVQSLSTLDAIARTVWWALVPFIAVVLGTLLPARVRGLFESFVGPTALINASLAVIFAHVAVLRLLKAIWAEDLKADLLKAIWSSNPAEPEEGPG